MRQNMDEDLAHVRITRRLPVMTQAAQATSQKETLRGGILEVLEVLVPEQRGDEIIAVVKKLVARNGELERRLTELLSRRRSSEGVVYDAVMAC
ncbi:MAG: hypothetical protein AAGC55_29685, partial [Myxococcota bacterium]